LQFQQVLKPKTGRIKGKQVFFICKCTY